MNIKTTPKGLERTLLAADRLASALQDPVMLISLHRDLGKLETGWAHTPRKKMSALRWGIFMMTYAAMEAFFNDVLSEEGVTRVLPLNPDKIRGAGQKYGVTLFTSDWGIRTRTKGIPAGIGNRSRWTTYEGVEQVRDYLADMKCLRDILSHGGDPYSTSNLSGALWIQQKGNSINLMGVEGFVQACIDMATQTILEFGGILYQSPEWSVPTRSVISAEKRPALTLLPGD